MNVFDGDIQLEFQNYLGLVRSVINLVDFIIKTMKAIVLLVVFMIGMVAAIAVASPPKEKYLLNAFKCDTSYCKPPHCRCSSTVLDKDIPVADIPQVSTTN